MEYTLCAQQRQNISRTSAQHCTNVIQMLYVYWVCHLRSENKNIRINFLSSIIEQINNPLSSYFTLKPHFASLKIDLIS